MDNILEQIVSRKIVEVARAKTINREESLRAMPDFGRKCASLSASFLHPERSGIVAEFKRKSPSKGTINARSNVAEIVKGYTAGGASAISVLTDEVFFGGCLADLQEARANSFLPILRKDFVIDPYQILEAKAYGADVILLIAAILSPLQIKQFAQFAKYLGLSVLLEVHNEQELQDNSKAYVDAIGVNNRNLNDFTVDIQHSFNLVEHMPPGVLKISESAISDVQIIAELKKAGYQGFLIGENFMKTPDPVRTFKEFVGKL